MKPRSFFRALFLSIAMMLIGLGALSTMVSAAGPGIRWSDPDNISESDPKSVYPVVTYDAAGKLHMAWLEYESDPEQSSRLMYTNNVGGSFRAPHEVTDNAGKNKDHILAIAVENNRVHLVYTDEDKALRHSLVNLDGARPSNGATTELVGDGDKAYMPTLAIDSSGRVHAAWIDNRGSEYQVFHRIWSNGNWEGGDRRVRGSDDFQSFPSLAPTNDGRMHILFKNGDGMTYAIYQDGGWRNQDAPSRDETNQQALASDGTRVFAVWSTRGHDIEYNEGTNGDWGDSRKISDGDQWSDFPEVFYSPANSRVYAVWAARLGSGSNTSVVIREMRPGGGQSDTAKIGDAPSAWARGAGGSTGIAVVWQDKSDGNEEAVLRTGVPGESTGPTATATGTVGPTVTPSPTVPPTPTPQPAPPTGNFGFASDAFQNVWTRTDSLVAGGAVPYSWIWGPNPFTMGVSEYYVQSPGEARQVQYFDKSRMEINNPNAPRDQWYVTNGRLTDELITGLLQVGDAQYQQRQPAAIPVAGDRENTFPLYRDLQAVYRRSYNSDRANQEIYRAPDGSVQTQLLANANSDPSMVIEQRIGGLGIPKVFWDYMNQPGQVVENGVVVTANPLYDWRYVIGEPLTEAYWTFIKVGGQDHGVLVQAFERRVLTYLPANPPGFQVEMGNIGRHYFEWRYGVLP